MKALFYTLAILLVVSCSSESDEPKAKPVIESFTPDEGKAGTIVTITGQHFSRDISQNIATFNGKIATINSATANELVVVVPEGASTGKVKVGVNGAVGQSANDFYVYDTPVIMSFTPDTGAAGTVVTITGSNFSPNPAENIVKFGDGIAVVTEATRTSLTVVVPDDAFVDYISVTTHGHTGKTLGWFYVVSTISDIEPMSAPVGAIITIRGTGLKGLPVYFLNSQAKKIAETATEVKVIAPYQNISDRSVPIHIDGYGLKPTWPTNFEYVRSSWVRKKDFPGVARQRIAGFAIGSKGYFGLGYDAAGAQSLKDFWEYDPSTDNWTRKNDFDGGTRFGTFSFAVGGRGYVGAGKDNLHPAYLKDMWGYEPVTDTWAPRAEFPGEARVGAGSFVINNKAYVGVGFMDNVKFKDYWEYDPDANSWTRKADWGGDGTFGFTLGDKGYSGGNEDGGFWEYDLSTDQWTSKEDVPNWIAGRSGELFGFSIDGKGYIGLNDFYYQYNSQFNFWNRMDYPAADFLYLATKAVVINGKAYVLRGTQLWEFTPPN